MVTAVVKLNCAMKKYFSRTSSFLCSLLFIDSYYVIYQLLPKSVVTVVLSDTCMHKMRDTGALFGRTFIIVELSLSET